jgi:hypothetical protein
MKELLFDVLVSDEIRDECVIILKTAPYLSKEVLKTIEVENQLKKFEGGEVCNTKNLLKLIL